MKMPRRYMRSRKDDVEVRDKILEIFADNIIRDNLTKIRP